MDVSPLLGVEGLEGDGGNTPWCAFSRGAAACGKGCWSALGS
jgi:hypothetical protein